MSAVVDHTVNPHCDDFFGGAESVFIGHFDIQGLYRIAFRYLTNNRHLNHARNHIKKID